MSDHSGIIGLSMGAGDRVNSLLAELILKKKDENPNLPIFVQKEISDFLPSGLARTIVGGKKYLNTYEVLSAMKKETDKKLIKLKYVYLFTHQGLMPRATLVARKLDFILMENNLPKMPWPKNDTQWWVRNPIFFWLREITASYPYFWWKGWI